MLTFLLGIYVALVIIVWLAAFGLTCLGGKARNPFIAPTIYAIFWPIFILFIFIKFLRGK